MNARTAPARPAPSAEGTVAWPADLAARYRAEGRWLDRTLFEHFADAVAQQPDAVAIVDGETRLTYADVLARAEGAAARLLAHGLAPDDRVVVQLRNSWHFAVLLLACFRSGILPVLALPAHRQTELTAIAQVAEARAIVVPDVVKGFDHRELAATVAEATPSLEHIIVLGEAAEHQISLEALLTPAEDAAAADFERPDPGAVALFLLSGGTTGLPKLIARTHNDYEYNARACAEVSGIDATSVYLVALPASHNFPLACPGILGVLFAGGRVVMLPTPDPARAFATMRSEGITITAAVPAVAQRWIDHAEAEGTGGLPLEVLQVGGSRMPDDVAVRVEPALGATLQQVFGMAEGLINMTRLDDPDDVIHRTQGRPVCDADEIRVVDPLGEDLPTGERGSILTRGPYTPRGYYRAPEANERSFLDGWYSSGDIVELRADGNLVVHGRDKDLINRGGEKISAEEIESLAYRVDGVELAAAVAMPDALMGERLCLYLVVREGVQVDLDTIRDQMAATGIAAFKLPERLEVVTDIPLTKVGKIDKLMLRQDITRRLEEGN